MNKPKIFSNKKLIGGGLLLAAAGAILSMLGGLFPGFGSGNGSGEGNGDVQITTSTDQEPIEATPSAQALEVDGIMDIIIDDTTYLIQKEDNTKIELKLEEIAERAPEMTGNAQGVKVRVSRMRSSLLSAERQLEKALQEAGLTDQQVQWVTAPID